MFQRDLGVATHCIGIDTKRRVIISPSHKRRASRGGGGARIAVAVAARGERGGVVGRRRRRRPPLRPRWVACHYAPRRRWGCWLLEGGARRRGGEAEAPIEEASSSFFRVVMRGLITYNDE